MEEKENNLNNNNKTNSLKKKKLKFKSLFSLNNSSSKKLNNNNNSDEQTTTIESVSTVRVTTTAASTTTNTIMTTATTTTGNENNNNTKMNNYNKKLNKSASSSDLNISNNNNCTKDAIQKYSIFGTIKRNFQNKFSPNRKIINEDNFLPIPLENNDNLNNNINNSSSCNDINSNGSDIVTPLERPSPEALKQSEEDEAVDKARMELTKYGWYWGSLSRTAAQRTLTGKPNGSFLVRNSETDRLQFTLSFRSANVTLHNRIYYVNGYWQIESQRYKSIVDLFEDTIRKSENCVFCYVKPVNRLLPPVPVRLTHPINRYYEVASLQHLCRFVLRSKFHLESFSNIQLPGKVRAYIEENFYENI